MLLLSLMLLPILGYAQNFRDEHKAVFEKVKQIDAQKGVKTVLLENEEVLDQITDGGAELTGFYKNGVLVKMKLKVYLSYGISTFLYYFSDGQLFFINEVFDQFSYDKRTDKFDHSSTERNFNGNYIFQNAKLHDYVTLGHNRFEDDAYDPEIVLLDEARRYQQLLDSMK